MPMIEDKRRFNAAYRELSDVLMSLIVIICTVFWRILGDRRRFNVAYRDNMRRFNGVYYLLYSIEGIEGRFYVKKVH